MMEIITLFFYSILLLALATLLYSLFIKRTKNVPSATRIAFRLTWLSLPMLLYSVIVILLGYFSTALNTFMANISTLIGFMILLSFCTLIPTYLKYGKNAVKDPNFFKQGSHQHCGDNHIDVILCEQCMIPLFGQNHQRTGAP